MTDTNRFRIDKEERRKLDTLERRAEYLRGVLKRDPDKPWARRELAALEWVLAYVSAAGEVLSPNTR